jgi:hypothetical protein
MKVHEASSNVEREEITSAGCLVWWNTIWNGTWCWLKAQGADFAP